MTEILYALAVLACPVGMGLMMWFMMRGGQRSKPPASPAMNDAELVALRAELDQLRAAKREARGNAPAQAGDGGPIE